MTPLNEFSCDPAAITALLDESLAAEHEEQLMIHLGSCPKCQRESMKQFMHWDHHDIERHERSKQQWLRA